VTEPFSKWAKPEFLPDLIPIIPPDATLLANSSVSLEMRGKTPGKYLADKLVWCGFTDFTSHVATEADIAAWNTWPDASIGLLARNHPAVDIDCTDPALAQRVHKAALEIFGSAPARTGNAPKRLLLYRGQPMKKHRLVFEMPSRSSATANSMSSTVSTRKPNGLTRGIKTRPPVRSPRSPKTRLSGSWLCASLLLR
jgi:hypothetical protein